MEAEKENNAVFIKGSRLDEVRYDTARPVTGCSS